MTQRNRAPKDDRILPTTTGIKSGCKWLDAGIRRSCTIGCPRRTLWPFGSPSSARNNPSRIHHRILWLASLATLSCVFRAPPEKRGTCRIMARNRFARFEKTSLPGCVVGPTVFNNNSFDTPGYRDSCERGYLRAKLFTKLYTDLMPTFDSFYSYLYLLFRLTFQSKILLLL